MQNTFNFKIQVENLCKACRHLKDVCKRRRERWVCHILGSLCSKLFAKCLCMFGGLLYWRGEEKTHSPWWSTCFLLGTAASGSGIGNYFGSQHQLSPVSWFFPSWLVICTCQHNGISRCSHGGCQAEPGTVTVIPAAHCRDSMVSFFSNCPENVPCSQTEQICCCGRFYALNMRHTFLP